MNIWWQRFRAALRPGVRVLIFLTTAVFALAVAGKLTHTVDLYQWLSLSTPDFWRGQIWRMVTYALLPAGIVDFGMSLLALVVLGSLLERHWSRYDLWLYCGLTAAGAGLAGALLAAIGPPPLTGAAPVMFGLLIAWGFLSGYETAFFPGVGQASVRRMVAGFGVVSFGLMLFTAGLIAALVMASGGLAGWIYLLGRRKLLMGRASHTVQSGRIRRLEL